MSVEVNSLPIIKSAIERAKTNVKANERNSAQLSSMRTAVKSLKKLLRTTTITQLSYTKLLLAPD